MIITRREDPSGWKVRWNETLAAKYRASGEWGNRTMADLAGDILKTDPGRVLAIEGDRSLTVTEIHAQARHLALTLLGKGLRPGDRVSYQLPNWSEAMVIDLACTMAGFVSHPLIPIYRGAELSFMLEDCGSKLIFIPAQFRGFDYRDMVRTQVLPKLTRPPRVVVVRGDAQEFTPYQSLFKGEASGELPRVDPDAVKVVLYTSGTTGRPKGVLHTHNTCELQGAHMAGYMALTGDDTSLVASPVTHITGATYAFLLPWVIGLRGVFMDTWNAETAVTLMETHGVTCMNGATPFLREILQAAQARGTHLPKLRVFTCGGASVPPQLMRDAYAWFENCAILRGHGCTEVPTTSNGIPRRDSAEVNSMSDGYPLYSEVLIADPETGGAVPWGEEGEVLMRGPQMLLGYLREEDNAAAFDARGFFRSGDLARYVRDNWLVISGRSKDLINRGGEKLSAREIEDALLEHPAIADIAAVAMPNPRTGEAVCAFIVAKGGQKIDIAEMDRFMTGRGMAKQKIPEHIVYVDDLPKTASGKVQKHVLREQAKKLVA